MKKCNYFFVFFLSFLLTGCAFNRTPFQNYPVQTEVQLNQANFRIVGTVFGYSRQIYVFGIGGMSKKSLTENAIMDMYENAHLTGSQAIVNVTTAVADQTVFGIYTTKRVVSRGSIIEFLDASGNPITSPTQQPELTSKNNASDNYIGGTTNDQQGTTTNQEANSLQSTSTSSTSSQAGMTLEQIDEANKCYIAWLYKTRNLNGKYIDKINKKYDFEAIKKFASKHTADELKEKSKGHDRIIEKYAIF